MKVFNKFFSFEKFRTKTYCCKISNEKDKKSWKLRDKRSWKS
jgi:hypothetical protein